MPNPPPATGLHIRWMIRRDMEEILEIEREAFDSPWLEADFVRHLRQLNQIGMVAEVCDRIAGYMVYRLTQTKIELLNLAVAGDLQRRGIGRQMMAKLQGKLSNRRRQKCETYVRDSNLGAHLFFKAVGWRATIVIPEYFEHVGGWTEDAYQFVCRYR